MTGLLHGRLMLSRQTAVAPVAAEQVALQREEDDDLRLLTVRRRGETRTGCGRSPTGPRITRLGLYE